MFKARARMLTGAMALGLASVIPAAAPVSAAGAAAPPCQLWVDAPYWESAACSPQKVAGSIAPPRGP